MASLLLDVDSGGYMMSNSHFRVEETIDNDDEMWFTEQELAGPKGFSCANLAKAALPGMTSRPHKQNPVLRDLGNEQIV